MHLETVEALRPLSLAVVYRLTLRLPLTGISSKFGISFPTQPASSCSFSGLEAQSPRGPSPCLHSPPSPEVYHNRAAEMTVWKCPLL